MAHHFSDLQVTKKAIETALQPTDAFVTEYMHPVEDDTWVRHAQLVKTDELSQDSADISARSVLVKKYQLDNGAQADETDPILSDLKRQEDFIKQYKQVALAEDHRRAVGYKEVLFNNFRSKKAQSSVY